MSIIEENKQEIAFLKESLLVLTNDMTKQLEDETVEHRKSEPTDENIDQVESVQNHDEDDDGSPLGEPPESFREIINDSVHPSDTAVFV